MTDSLPKSSTAAGTGVPGVRLLVSVRSSDEAQLALNAGVDIVDVKSPSAGPLGMASEVTWSEVSRCIAGQNNFMAPPLSLALGEVSEWQRGGDTPAVPDGTRWLKVGPCFRGHPEERRAAHVRLRSRFSSVLQSPAEWVTVWYADGDPIECGTFSDQIDLAKALDTDDFTGAGILIDTMNKSAGSLVDRFGLPRIAEWCDKVKECGLWIAIAGRLRLEDLELVAGAGADVIGVRSAVCRQNDRQNGMDADRLATAVKIIRQSAVERQCSSQFSFGRGHHAGDSV